MMYVNGRYAFDSTRTGIYIVAPGTHLWYPTRLPLALLLMSGPSHVTHYEKSISIRPSTYRRSRLSIVAHGAFTSAVPLPTGISILLAAHHNVNFLHAYLNKTFYMGKASPYVSTLSESEGY